MILSDDDAVALMIIAAILGIIIGLALSKFPSVMNALGF